MNLEELSGWHNEPEQWPNIEMNRQQLAAIWEQRAHKLAAPPAAVTKGQALTLLSFALGGATYAIEVRYVREIHAAAQITRVPRTPAFIAGVINARGRLISLINLHAFLALPGSDPVQNGKIVVLAVNDLEVGLLVDDISGITNLFKETLQPVTSDHMGIQAEYIEGITPDMAVLLNLPSLLNSKRLTIDEELV
jgi:purine-binding chemotaxis protein CheW